MPKLLIIKKKFYLKPRLKVVASYLFWVSNIFFFQTISTDSSVQFYTMISNKRYRVTKQFYKSLNDYAKIVVGIGGTLRKKQCNKINEIITTPLTWVGNKSKVCNSIFATLPNSIVNYYEPFLGSGSVLLHVLQQQSEGKITIKSNIFVWLQ